MRDLTGKRPIMPDGALKRSIIRLVRHFVKHGQSDSVETKKYRIEKQWSDSYSKHGALKVTDKTTGNVYTVNYEWHYGSVIKVGGVEVYSNVEES